MDNEILNRLPANIIRYSGFYNLIKALNKYIEESNENIRKCVAKHNMVPVNQLDADTSLTHILNLAQRNNVRLKYLPKGFSEGAIKALYISALVGSSAKRTSYGDKDSVTKSLLTSFSNITNVQIETTNPMEITVTLTATSSSVLNNLPELPHYILPELTGVTIVINIINSETLKSMKISSGTTESSSTLNTMQVTSGTTQEIIASNTAVWMMEFN